MDPHGRMPKRSWVERTVAANTYVAHSGMRRWLNEALGPWRIDALAGLLMRMLRLRNGAAAMSVLSVYLFLPPSTVTSAIVRLEKRGYARRYRSHIDARVWIAELTPAGLARSEPIAWAIDDIEMQAEQAAGSDMMDTFNRMASYIAVIDDELSPGGW